MGSIASGHLRRPPLAKQKPEVPRLAYSVPEYAEAIRLCTKNVYEMVRKGEVPHVVVGGRILIPAVAGEAPFKKKK